ncbi:MAG TPA: hypothetical protein ENF30_02630 [Candidatus Desulfofervidus auxilii]|uniref:Tyr recombinase domain-containing protein n=1 Tax=Desulfofervidus auxilii TaxID=1621989 RepID=A0A7V0NEL4_DESA2|nr:hypothetical protein [Candidatus Desulfofervidus auxilii]
MFFGMKMVSLINGVDLMTVKELLGHKTISMTTRYAHLAPSHIQKAVAVLDGAIHGKNMTIRRNTQKWKI